MTRGTSPHWTVYAGIGVTVFGLCFEIGREAASAWRDLQVRVQRLEDRDLYEHGSFPLPAPERK